MKLKNRLYELKELILEQFFPATCPFCGKVISFRLSCCGNCEAELEFLDSVCARCAKYECICERLLFLDRVHALFSYEGITETAIRRFKFQNHPEYAKVFARYIAKHFGTNQIKESFDCIVFVPMDKSHKSERGYNQAEELALELGLLCDIPVLDNALYKAKKTAPQHFLNFDERRENLRGAFALGDDSVAGKRVLVCDDVYTTGNTLECCAEVLKESGAACVEGFVIASAQ